MKASSFSERHSDQLFSSKQKMKEVSISVKWSERMTDFQHFSTLLDSRSNIFVHGPNGSGKTTFVTDCMLNATR